MFVSAKQQSRSSTLVLAKEDDYDADAAVFHLEEKSKKDNKQDSKAYTLFLCGSSGRPSSYGYVKADADGEKPLATTNQKGGARWESFRLVAAGAGCFRILSQHDTPWTLGGFDRTQFIILAGKGIIGGTPLELQFVPTAEPDGVTRFDKDSAGHKKKKAKDPNAPKRAKSAYLYFSAERTPQLKQDDADPPNPFDKDTEKAEHSQWFMKRVGAEWTAMDEDARQPYQALAEKDKKRHAEEMERYKPPPKEDNASAVAQGGGLSTPELPSGGARVLDRSDSRVLGAGASSSGDMKFRVGDAVSVRTTEAVWPRHTEGKVITIETDEEEEPYEVKNSAGQEPKTWWFSEDELELVSAARPEPARGASGGKVWWKDIPSSQFDKTSAGDIPRVLDKPTFKDIHRALESIKIPVVSTATVGLGLKNSHSPSRL